MLCRRFHVQPASAQLDVRYFEDLGADGPEIDPVSVATRKKERVTLLKGISRVSKQDSGVPWNGAAPDGSPLIKRDVGSRELYSFELQLP